MTSLKDFVAEKRCHQDSTLTPKLSLADEAFSEGLSVGAKILKFTRIFRLAINIPDF